jgi:hypothetical protein
MHFIIYWLRACLSHQRYGVTRSFSVTTEPMFPTISHPGTRGGDHYHGVGGRKHFLETDDLMTVTRDAPAKTKKSETEHWINYRWRTKAERVDRSIPALKHKQNSWITSVHWDLCRTLGTQRWRSHHAWVEGSHRGGDAPRHRDTGSQLCPSMDTFFFSHGHSHSNQPRSSKTNPWLCCPTVGTSLGGDTSVPILPWALLSWLGPAALGSGPPLPWFLMRWGSLKPAVPSSLWVCCEIRFLWPSGRDTDPFWKVTALNKASLSWCLSSPLQTLPWWDQSSPRRTSNSGFFFDLWFNDWAKLLHFWPFSKSHFF